MRPRDNQRSRVYEWEAKATGGSHWRAEFETLEECESFMFPIWRSERGRYGRAKVPPPTLSRNLWGQQRATASASHELKLPKWARNPWVILHEMAHRLVHRGEAHGPRFVGVLIGLACRHAGHDAQALVNLACEMGVKVDVRSIGAVPAIRMSDKVAKLLPCTVMEAAVELGVSWRVIHGCTLTLIREGRARYLRGRIVALVPSEGRGLTEG